MPRRYRRRPRRRRRKRRPYRYSTARALSLTKTPLPRMLKTTLRYSTPVSIDPGAGGTCSVHVFSANGLYDPDITGVGHQPRGFDELMGLYDHYVCIGSKISVQATNSDGTYACVTGVSLRDDNTVETDANNYLEQGTVKSMILNQRNGGKAQGAMTLSFNNKFLGRSKPLADSQLKGSDSANPEEQAYFHVWVAPVRAGTDVQQTDAIVTIDYIVMLIEPTDITQS